MPGAWRGAGRLEDSKGSRDVQVELAGRHLGVNRERMAQWLRSMELAELIEPQDLPSGCVVFPRIQSLGQLRSTMELVEQLEARHGVLVAPGEFFGIEYGQHIRIGFGGDSNRLDRGLTRLAEGLKSLRT